MYLYMKRKTTSCLKDSNSIRNSIFCYDFCYFKYVHYFKCRLAAAADTKFPTTDNSLQSRLGALFRRLWFCISISTRIIKIWFPTRTQTKTLHISNIFLEIHFSFIYLWIPIRRVESSYVIKQKLYAENLHIKHFIFGRKCMCMWVALAYVFVKNKPNNIL